MNELIKLEQVNVNGQMKQGVSARDLHQFLGVKRMFAHWIKERIEAFDFVENQDYVELLPNLAKTSAGRPSIEYYLTIDMAKELCMVERNEKGKQARQYFIECERVAQSKFDVRNISRAQVAQLLLESEKELAEAKDTIQKQESKLIALDERIAKDAPKVNYAETVVKSTDTIHVGDAAKLFGIPVRKFRQWLHDIQAMCKYGNFWQSMFVSKGYGIMRQSAYYDNYGRVHTSYTPLLTQQGLYHLHGKALRQGLISMPTPTLALAA